MNLYKRHLVRVQLVREKSPAILASSPEEVVKLVRKEMEKFDREYLVSIFLSTSNRVLGIEETSKGTLNASPVSAREVFKGAILCSAASLVILHNHPGGSSKPSEDDRRVTKMLQQASSIIGIDLLDHIIVVDGGYTSFKENGLL